MPLPEIDGYTVFERLGTGGFAAVYAATRLVDDERVAIKVLHDHTSKEADLRRFEREALTMRAFNGHPNIVSVFDSGITKSGLHYAVLEFVGGGSVRDLLAEQRALHWSEALRIGGHVASALDVAHRSGVLHRDVKPANILLDDDKVKLSDFGIARLVGQSNVTAAQSIIGTLAYTPPEIFHGNSFDGRGDIYQLGISLYEMLLGRPPFSSAASDNKATIIRRILDKPAPPLEQFDIPAPVSDLLEQVLAKDPADRPQSANRFAELLKDIELELGVSPIVPVSSPSTNRSSPARTDQPDGSATVAMEPPFENEPVFPAAHDADLTVVSEAAEPHTAVMAIEQREDQPVDSERRRPWLGVLVALVLLAAAGAGYAFTQLDDPTTSGEIDDQLSQDDLANAAGDGTSGFTAITTEVFSQPEGSDGIVFASVANSQGLTIVGSAGDSEQLVDQRAVVWTLGSNGFALGRDVAQGAPHRMWDIGVIGGTTFLAVGDTAGGNGVAWTGDRAATLVEATNPDLAGDGTDYLRASVHDPSLGDTFLVGGRFIEGATEVPAIWQVRANPTWDSTEWTRDDIGSSAPGVINDIAVDGTVAAAVGVETVDGQDVAIMKIRQDGVWSNLIGPVEDVVLWSVAIADERIIAVGVQNSATNPTPVAIIADTVGTAPRRHSLPIRSGDGGVETGVARSVRALDDGRVLVVGSVERSLDATNPDAALDTDGAIWELLPGNALSSDLWTTTMSSDLVVDGFVELWAIEEFEDTVYIFGRTETEDGRRPAGAWTLN